MSDGDDFERRLRAQLARAEAEAERDVEYADAWLPEPGETLIGRVERIDDGETKYGECRIATIVERDGSQHALWITRKVLRDEWSTADPKVGEHVAVEYVGMRESAGGGSSYHLYRVAVDRPETGALPTADPVDATPADDDIPF